MVRKIAFQLLCSAASASIVGAGAVSSGQGGGEGVVAGAGAGGGSGRPKVTLSLSEGYDSNVMCSSTPVGSFYTELDASAGWRWEGARGELEIGGTGGVGYYYSSELDRRIFPQGGIYLDSSYELSSRTSVFLSADAQYISQPDFSTAPGSYSDQGNYLVAAGSVGVEHRWRPRISTISSWEADVYSYAESYYQNALGRIEQTGSNQLLFLWKPSVSLVQEYRINPRTYFGDSSMDSLGQFFLFGADQKLNPRSKLHSRFGVEQRWLNEPQSGRGFYIGPYGELGAAYSTGRNDLDFTARYGTQSSGLVGVGEADSLQLSLTGSRRLGAKTKVTAYGSYQLNRFDQQQSIGAFDDSVFDCGVGVERKLGKRVSLELGVRYSTVLSTSDQERGYGRTMAFIGTKVDL